MLRKYDDDLYDEFKKEKVLTKVLDLIHNKRYDEAGYTWTVHSQKKAPDVIYNKSTINRDDGVIEKWSLWGKVSSPIHRQWLNPLHCSILPAHKRLQLPLKLVETHLM